LKTQNITIDAIEDIPFTDEGDPDYDSNWDIDYQKSITIEEGRYELVKVTVTSTDDSVLADGDKIDLTFVATGKDLTFVATGKTGIDSKDATVKVDEKAVEYNINITVEPEKQEVKPGEHCIYNFNVKNMNTGIWPDNYLLKVTSEHGWDLDISYDDEDLKEVDVGDEFTVEVTVNIPKHTDISSDVLSFKVTSRNSGLDHADRSKYF